MWRELAGPEPHDRNYVIQSGCLDGDEGVLGVDVEPPTEEYFQEHRAKWLKDTGLPYANAEEKAANILAREKKGD
jgi:hypothetical protein